MSLQGAARAAYDTFPHREEQGLFLPTLMVAIAGAESGWVDDRAGDPGTGPGSCGGYTSFGLWQIHLPAHASMLEQLMGSADPCAQAAWLAVPEHCARAALLVYQSQGLGAWTSWQTGAWRAYLPQAQAAIAQLEAGSGSSAGSGSGSGVPGQPLLPSAAWPAVVIGLAGAGAAAILTLRRRHVAAWVRGELRHLHIGR